ncbi:MAG: 30S ribosomal protein S6 [Clostridiaceae bacterium]|nr:30S ribosomal protein S6 [Clostridiaceae bacterium]
MANKYELVTVLSTLQGDEAVKALAEKVDSMLTSLSSVIDKDDWGARRLAYEIEDQREGYYTVYQLEAEPEAPAEIERLLKITDGVLRWLIVKKD